MAEAENLYVLTGLQGQTLTSDEIQAAITSTLETKKIPAQVKSVYAGFTSADVGLKQFQSEELLGVVKLSGGNVKQLDGLNVSGSITIRSLQKDAFGLTEVRLQEHIIKTISSIQDLLIELCKRLGLKLTKDQQNIRLIGDSLSINIARHHLNTEYHRSLQEFVFGTHSKAVHDMKQLGKLSEMFVQNSMKGNDVILSKQSTAYLSLAFFVGKVPALPDDKSVFIVPEESCSEARLECAESFTSRTQYLQLKDYGTQLKDCMAKLRQLYQPIYLTHSMQLDSRSLTESLLEKMYQPTLFIKCKRKHWSCYIFPAERVTEVQQLVSNCVKDTARLPLDEWWSKLPDDILVSGKGAGKTCEKKHDVGQDECDNKKVCLAQRPEPPSSVRIDLQGRDRPMQPEKPSSKPQRASGLQSEADGMKTTDISFRSLTPSAQESAEVDPSAPVSTKPSLAKPRARGLKVERSQSMKHPSEKPEVNLPN